jgi:hypothetical protein
LFHAFSGVFRTEIELGGNFAVREITDKAQLRGIMQTGWQVANRMVDVLEYLLAAHDLFR